MNTETIIMTENWKKKKFANDSPANGEIVKCICARVL